jgi:hypothetical protein
MLSDTFSSQKIKTISLAHLKACHIGYPLILLVLWLALLQDLGQ